MTASPPAPGAPTPYFDHAGRVRLLRNAAEVAASCDHRALARLRNVVETLDGPVLLYHRAPGELIATPAERRGDPASPYRRFASLPADRHVPAVPELLDAHVALARAGWVACDLYDGCLLFDFATDLGRMALHLGTATTDDPAAYVGGPDRAAVLVRATSPDAAARHPDVATLAAGYASAA